MAVVISTFIVLAAPTALPKLIVVTVNPAQPKYSLVLDSLILEHSPEHFQRLRQYLLRLAEEEHQVILQRAELRELAVTEQLVALLVVSCGDLMELWKPSVLPLQAWIKGRHR